MTIKVNNFLNGGLKMPPVVEGFVRKFKIRFVLPDSDPPHTLIKTLLSVGMTLCISITQSVKYMSSRER